MYAERNLAIYLEWKQGATQAQLARAHAMSTANVCRIVRQQIALGDNLGIRVATMRGGAADALVNECESLLAENAMLRSELSKARHDRSVLLAIARRIVEGRRQNNPDVIKAFRTLDALVPMYTD